MAKCWPRVQIINTARSAAVAICALRERKGRIASLGASRIDMFELPNRLAKPISACAGDQARLRECAACAGAKRAISACTRNPLAM
ncbi:hypothetical protein [Lysobacter gummosus]|uniref:hypothetical protein n=1 Tax=Lysobacter gummosus TaxID=262324 RepID=UPI0036329D67